MAYDTATRQAPLLELTAPNSARADHALIASMVSPRARVLDLGCGNGALLHLLARERGVRGRGIDIDQARVNACVAKGLPVVQGDVDRDLAEFPSAAYDYVVLANTIQSLSQPREALKQAARIGERVIVSIANFGHWRQRTRVLTQGRLPAWSDGEALHPCSVRDLAELARDLHLDVERGAPISRGNAGAPFAKTIWRANWFAEEAVLLLSQN